MLMVVRGCQSDLKLTISYQLPDVVRTNTTFDDFVVRLLWNLFCLCYQCYQKLLNPVNAAADLMLASALLNLFKNSPFLLARPSRTCANMIFVSQGIHELSFAQVNFVKYFGVSQQYIVTLHWPWRRYCHSFLRINSAYRVFFLTGTPQKS